LARILIIEDRLHFAAAVVKTISRVRPAIAAEDVIVRSHRDLHGADLDAVELILLDAIDFDTQQDDRTASRLGALRICDLLHERRSQARVVAYSSAMDRPELHIPLREYPFVEACVVHSTLLVQLPAILDGQSPAHAVPLPTVDDYRRLRVEPAARLAEGHRLMTSRPDAWRLVWDAVSPTPEPRTREWINDRVRPVVRPLEPGYKPVVRVMRRLSGLPVQRTV
jgi:hypothetical protein